MNTQQRFKRDRPCPVRTRGPVDARDLALGDALAARRLHEVLDAAGGDAPYVGLLHDGQQLPLAASAQFEQGDARERYSRSAR